MIFKEEAYRVPCMCSPHPHAEIVICNEVLVGASVFEKYLGLDEVIKMDASHD